MSFSREDLIGRFWRFGSPTNGVYATQLTLLRDGRVGGYLQDNEHRWDVSGGKLILFDRVGRRTTVFDTVEEVDGRLRFEGSFMGRRDLHHYLTETEPFARLPDAGQAVRVRAREGLVRRRNLVVIRANDRSLHKSWRADIKEDERNWDLCLSWYGNPDGYPDDELAQYHVVQDKELKWKALWRLLGESSPFWDYDYVMLPDDDLAWSWSGVNLAFEVARDHDLLLAQPSLAPSGYVIHEITRTIPEYRLHFTNFVEVMAPIFSNEALRLCAPTFSLTNLGFGIDHVWPKLLGGPRHRIAVIDETSIVHTRPQGQSYGLGDAIVEGQKVSASYKAEESYQIFGAIKR